MGRRERPLDPAAGPVARFAYELRKLRQEAGGPTYREMAARSSYSAATLAQAAAGGRLPSLPVTLAYVAACGGPPTDWERRWQRARTQQLAEPPGADDDAESPYMGLRRFQPQDRRVFFGRDQLLADLVALVRDHRVTVVVGASGSGKSSLLRAGLIPALQSADAGTLPAALRILTPGPRPARTHARLLTPEPSDIGTDTVVVVDQFEEIFTLCGDPAERNTFIDLLTAARAPGSRLRVVVAVRADFFGRLAEHRALAVAAREATLLITPMTPAELREAIIRPAAAVGLIVERALTARLVDEVGGNPGGLPLLSHVLLQIWRRRRGNALTLEAFEAAGGLGGSLARTAEELYEKLTSAQQRLARLIFLRLTALGDGTEDTMRPASPAELEGLAEQADDGDVSAVLDRAARARLLTLDRERVELAHEALIRCWPRLHGWLTEDREAMRVLRQLTDAADTWETLRRDPGALYRGTRLDLAAALDRAFLSVQERDFLDASQAAADRELATAQRGIRRLRRLAVLLTALLLTASAAVVYAVHAQHTATRQRNIALSEKVAEQATALRATNPALATQLSLAAYRLAATTEARGGLLSTFATPYATRLTRHTDNVNSVAYRADSRTLVTAGNDDTARLWNVADPHHPHPLAVLTGHTEKVSHAAFAPDGHTLATASWDDTARLWDTTAADRPRLRAVLRGHTADVNAVAFRADGRTLATASTDSTVRLWDVTDPRRPRTTAVLRPDDTGTAIVTVAFSPDGRTLAAAGFDSAVHLWRLDAAGTAHESETLKGHSAAVSWVAFGPHGTTLASASWDKTVRLWDLATPGRPRPPITLTGHTDGVRSVAISPDGHTVASASLDHTVRVWDIGNPRHPRRRTILRGHTDAAVFVNFSPDGRTLASAGDDHTARLWDLPLPALHGHTDAVCGLALSPNGHMLATAGYDRTARLWDITTPGRPRALATLTGHADAVCGLALSPNGRTLATAGYDRTARLWDITTPGRPRALATLTGYGDHVNTAAFSPDGRTLVTSGLDGVLRLWDVTDARRPHEVASAAGHTGGANAAVFSPDGTTLATGGWDRRVRLWNIGDPRHPRRLAASRVLPDGVNAVAFRPDGTALASTEFGGATRLWRITGRRLHQTAAFGGHVGDAYSPAFSPDGTTLTTTGADGTALLWNAADPHRPRLLAALSDPDERATAVFTAAFGPDGHTLATAGADGTARLWETAPDRVAEHICRLAHPTVTRAEWNTYFENLAYRPPCP
ncbi:hypothetical protein [Streptomyces sp. MMBL 11-3]|uniref:nSTAND1 domain-containing NTPase n=1 Tax=Streptomyces sp. MMBL 11-3 TaxID=3382639 RepID=UPI0039B3760B